MNYVRSVNSKNKLTFNPSTQLNMFTTDRGIELYITDVGKIKFMIPYNVESTPRKQYVDINLIDIYRYITDIFGLETKFNYDVLNQIKPLIDQKYERVKHGWNGWYQTIFGKPTYSNLVTEINKRDFVDKELYDLFLGFQSELMNNPDVRQLQTRLEQNTQIQNNILLSKFDWDNFEIYEYDIPDDIKGLHVYEILWKKKVPTGKKPEGGMGMIAPSHKIRIRIYLRQMHGRPNFRLKYDNRCDNIRHEPIVQEFKDHWITINDVYYHDTRDCIQIEVGYSEYQFEGYAWF